MKLFVLHAKLDPIDATCRRCSKKRQNRPTNNPVYQCMLCGHPAGNWNFESNKLLYYEQLLDNKNQHQGFNSKSDTNLYLTHDNS